MEVFAIKGTPRTINSKAATKAVRRAGDVPCVLYGGEEPIHFSTAFNNIKGLVYTPDFKIAEIEVDGTAYRCILKDIQFHPLTDAVNHIDFLHLVDGNAIKVEVPVRFTGSAPGEKAGGKLMPALRRIKIKTTPENLVDQVTLDISELELGQSIRVRDIEAIEGVEILNAPGIPVASVEIPRALRSAEAEELEALEGAEGEGTAEGATEEATDAAE